jgi:DNA-binding NtrC family response regulator
MTLEEARAVRVLCDRISALLAVSSALARSRERELGAVARAERIEAERDRLEALIVREASHNQAWAERIAHRARAAAYGPASRQAVEQIERRAKDGAPLLLTIPTGIDGASWAALAHLHGPRRGGRLVVADGADGALHSLERWMSPETSPLSIADGGTLVLLDAAALPLEVQDYVARTLGWRAEALGQSGVPPAGVVATLREPARNLVAAGRLSRTLAGLLGETAVEVPPLSARGEDLRALALDALARSGARVRGAPLGIDPQALRLLLEHDWPGNDAELDDVMVRAASTASGPLVTAADLARIGFSVTGLSSRPPPSRPRVARGSRRA